MFECMQVNNRAVIFGIEKTRGNKYVIYKDNRNAVMRTDAVLYDNILLWIEIEPFETLKDCYDFMISHIDDLM